MSRGRAAAVAAAAGVIALVIGTSAARAGGTEEQAVAAALKEAVAAAQQSFSSPAAIEAGKGLRVGENPTASDVLTSGPSRAEVQRVDAAGRTLLEKHFVGSALADRITSHSAMIAAQEDRSVPGFTPLGGGVSGLDAESVSVDGDTAAVHARVTTWARMSQVEPDSRVVVSQPSNDLLVDASLVRTSDGWKVSTYDWVFAPGSEP